MRWVDEITFDPNPMYAVVVVYDTEGRGQLKSWMAFDPRYGPETQQQIDWHLENGTPGAELWEIGTPAAPYA